MYMHCRSVIYTREGWLSWAGQCLLFDVTDGSGSGRCMVAIFVYVTCVRAQKDRVPLLILILSDSVIAANSQYLYILL